MLLIVEIRSVRILDPERSWVRMRLKNLNIINYFHRSYFKFYIALHFCFNNWRAIISGSLNIWIRTFYFREISHLLGSFSLLFHYYVIPLLFMVHYCTMVFPLLLTVHYYVIPPTIHGQLLCYSPLLLTVHYYVLPPCYSQYLLINILLYSPSPIPLLFLSRAA